MVTVVCCYNNEECLKKMLLPSLNRQKQEVQRILIDNNQKKYVSAAMAYNKEVIKAEGDIIIFCHQDIAFDDENFIDDIEKVFQKTPNIILGMAGIKKDGFVYSQLKYYKTKEYITQKRLSDKLEEVESIDECFFAIKREHLMKLMFDEVVCDNWHLYAVEFCYRAKHADLKLKSMVTSIQAYHKMEPGTGLEVDEKFIKTMKKVCKKYADLEEEIYAPCYITATRFPKKQFKLLKTKIKTLVNK